MDEKSYQRLKPAVTVFLIILVCLAVLRAQYLLAVIGIATGLIFLRFIGAPSKRFIDERERSIQEKAAQITYLIFAPTLGLSSLIMLLLARDQFFFLESLGVIFAYLTILLISLYTISSYFLNRKYGGNGQEE